MSSFSSSSRSSRAFSRSSIDVEAPQYSVSRFVQSFVDAKDILPPKYVAENTASWQSDVEKCIPHSNDVGSPPPYPQSFCNVSCNDEPEPETLAQYYFKYGFAFPLLWIFGACIICSPLRVEEFADSALKWLPGKTEGEKSLVLQRLRQAELKWAWRCFWACVTLLCLLIAAAFVALRVLASRHT